VSRGAAGMGGGDDESQIWRLLDTPHSTRKKGGPSGLRAEGVLSLLSRETK